MNATVATEKFKSLLRDILDNITVKPFKKGIGSQDFYCF